MPMHIDKRFPIFTYPAGPQFVTPSKSVLSCLMMVVVLSGLSLPSRGDTITSTVIADVGSSPLEVEDSQTNTFLPLSATATRNRFGSVTNSSVSATFTSEDVFQVNISNDWDSRNATGPFTIGFGTHFDYEFVADGSLLEVGTDNFVEQPLFSGARTFGAGPLRWRLFDLTVPNGFVVMDFSGNGMQSLAMVEGHSYSLQLSDQSAVSAGPGSLDLGLLHTVSFDVSLEALFNPGDFDSDGDVDGFDFLEWQRGETDPPLDPTKLAAWEESYGTLSASAATASATLSASVTAVPEPSVSVLVMVGVIGLFSRRSLKWA